MTSQFTFDDEAGSVHVRKRVSKGERLVIENSGDRVTLDALLLEGLSWQRERDVLREAVTNEAALDADPISLSTEAIGGGDDAITVSNEYAHVRISEVDTDAGTALRLEAPGRGTAVTLGVSTLRALASIENTYALSRWFETPFGPEDAPLEGPL